MKHVLLIVSLLAVLLPGGSHAGSRWADLFDPRALMTGLVQYGVLALRTQVDLTYSGFTVDPVDNTLIANDIHVWHTPSWALFTEGDCSVSIDRLAVRGAQWNDPARMRLRVDATGVVIQPACLPQEVSSAVLDLDLSTLVIPRLTLDVEHHLPSAGAEFWLFVPVDGVGTLSIQVDFEYIAISPWWLLGEVDELTASLRSASLTLENQGLWERLIDSMSPDLIDPELGPSIVTGLLWLQQGELLGEQPTKAAAQGYSRFVRSVERSMRQFLLEPSMLVLQTGFDPADPIGVFLEDVDNPADLFEFYAPQVSTTPLHAQVLLPGEQVASVLAQDVSTLTADARRSVGLALLRGEGVPLHREQALRLLDGLATDGDGEVGLALAQAFADDQPAQAYVHALQASSLGVRGGLALLDLLEPRLGAETVFALQPGLMELNGDIPTDVRVIRDRAERHFDGRAVRSYVLAAYWARLAAAAGDRAGRRLLDDIDERMRTLDAGEAWRIHDAQVADQALRDWGLFDIPTRLGAHD